MISSIQIRGGLAMLKWSKATAAEKAKIGEATVQRIRQDYAVTEGNRERLIDAMKDAGVEFCSDGWVRVRGMPGEGDEDDG